jgi:hypothetical protein
MRTLRRATALTAVLLAMPLAANAVPIQVDFEGLGDLAVVGAVAPGVNFSNAVVLTAFVSLNEIDFPPRSGANVVFSPGPGPMEVTFAAPVFSVGGYFTYLDPVTLSAYDAANNLLASVTSAFAANHGGLPGSSPNEFVGLTSLVGIATVRLTAPTESAFTLDDFVFDAQAPVVTVPEPGSLSLLLLGAVMLLGRRRSAAAR